MRKSQESIAGSKLVERMKRNNVAARMQLLPCSCRSYSRVKITVQNTRKNKG